MIRVSGLEKRYGAVRAVKDVSFEVGRGEIVGLLGHNGAGKSTVMKVITGYLEPSEGSVSVGGVDVVSDRLGVQRMIGYMPENAPLYPEMLVQEYLLMIAELRGMAAGDRIKAVADAVRATGLEAWMVRPISTLSKGYRQRVGLAQAIIHRPEVLVLDEPTSGLDPVQIVEIRNLIRRLAQSSTVILSTHILSEIEAVCDRVVILIDGGLAADSKLGDLLASDRVRVSVKTGTEAVEKTLAAVDGVGEVVRVGPDINHDGYEIWTVRVTGAGGNDSAGEPTATAVVAAAGRAGWSVASISTDTQNLEQVFRDLMSAHVAREGSPGGGPS
ncbi:MAG: ATP-binding cassette domain-containing protein [Myxococcales bacterium]|jgi:ABC-2 type transport system ATP-binding protein|nr:MAG: ATP-binding cassette domain-containing protein [Myxococcales bacterium]